MYLVRIGSIVRGTTHTWPAFLLADPTDVVLSKAIFSSYEPSSDFNEYLKIKIRRIGPAILEILQFIFIYIDMLLAKPFSFIKIIYVPTVFIDITNFTNIYFKTAL